MKPPFLLTTLVATLCLCTTRASAHARLDHAEPKVGCTCDACPAEVKIWFTDDLDTAGTDIEVLDASGHRVDKRDLHVDAKDKSAAAVSLPAQLPPGKYKVVWHALCPQGHKTKGEFKFDVKGG